MQFLNLESLIAFVCGMAIVYMMFRGMGVFIFMLLLTVASSASAQTTNVVTASPVYMAQNSTVDVSAAALAGFGFGLLVCGFGWVLRISKRVTGYVE